jgi:hypothetical protein
MAIVKTVKGKKKVTRRIADALLVAFFSNIQ